MRSLYAKRVTLMPRDIQVTRMLTCVSAQISKISSSINELPWFHQVPVATVISISATKEFNLNSLLQLKHGSLTVSFHNLVTDKLQFHCLLNLNRDSTCLSLVDGKVTNNFREAARNSIKGEAGLIHF